MKKILELKLWEKILELKSRKKKILELKIRGGKFMEFKIWDKKFWSCKFKGAAKHRFAYKINSIKSWKDFKDAFTNTFISNISSTTEKWSKKMVNRKQKFGEFDWLLSWKVILVQKFETGFWRDKGTSFNRFDITGVM